MNVFAFEFRLYRRSLLGWSICLVALLFVFMPFLPMFLEEAATLRSMLGVFGSAMLAALGINMQLLFSPVGFYGYLFTYISMAASIQALALGIELLGREHRMKTADFLLTRPLSRGSIYRSKVLSGIGSLLLTQCLYYLCSWLLMRATAESFHLPSFLLINFSLTLIQLLFLALGLCLAALLQRIKAPNVVAVSIVLALFALGMLSAVLENDFLRFLSPMKYFDANYILTNGHYDPSYLALSLTATAIFGLLSYILYIKKDVHGA